MPKMQNISDFRQTLVYEGQKTIMRAGDVIEVSRELSDVFLEKVPDDTPVTVKVGDSTRFIDRITAKVNEIESGTEEGVRLSSDLAERIQNSVNAKLNDMATDFDESMGSLADKLSALKNIFDNRNTQTEQELQKITRRLGILKSALMTIEDEIYGDADQGN